MAEEDFDFQEEEYNNEGELEEDLEAARANPKHWWSVVNGACTDVQGGDDESDGVRSGSDLDSLCSDEDEPSSKKRWSEYNPNSNTTDFQFKIGKAFRR